MKKTSQDELQFALFKTLNEFDLHHDSINQKNIISPNQEPYDLFENLFSYLADKYLSQEENRLLNSPDLDGDQEEVLIQKLLTIGANLKE